VKCVRALGGVALVLGTAGQAIPHMDALDDENLVFEDDCALGL